MKKSFLIQLILIGILISINYRSQAQSGFNDDRVILQGFYWESYRHGNPQFKEIVAGQPNIKKVWYDMVKSKAADIRKGRFNIIWLPNPSGSADGAGYGPTEYYNLNNYYGDSVKQRKLLVKLWKKGIEPVADIVINHRAGTHNWTGFTRPIWQRNSICKNDEAFYDQNSEAKDTPENQRGADEENVSQYDNNLQKAYAYGSFRDLDHTNTTVRNDLLRYLLYLKSMGYRGWRYDMVHGYHASHIAYFNTYTTPTFSVGEYDWGNQNAWRGWIWNTSTNSTSDATTRLKTSSNVFDFTTFFNLKNYIGADGNNQANYVNLFAYGNGLGLMGDNTDGISWKNRAVTFLENHDTGWRTNADGSNMKRDGKDSYDSFANNWQVEQGYAYILTHPGIPCVYWKHYFDLGSDLQNKIITLINARKVAGINSGSSIHTQDNAKQANVYAAMIEGTNGQLYVRIGGDDTNWEPSKSNYTHYREYAAGNGWKVWVTLNDSKKNKKYQKHALAKSLGTIPEIRYVSGIEVE